MKDLQLAGISDIAAGNACLPALMECYSERFAVLPARTQDLHRPLRTTTPRLHDILCHRQQRYAGAQLTFHYDCKQIVAKGLEGHHVELFRGDGRTADALVLAEHTIGRTCPLQRTSSGLSQ